MDSRSAFAAACRRALTSPSSRAARSIRSCWVSARSSAPWACSRSARSWFVNSATCFVNSASWPAISAESDSELITPPDDGSHYEGSGTPSSTDHGGTGASGQSGGQLFCAPLTRTLGELQRDAGSGQVAADSRRRSLETSTSSSETQRREPLPSLRIDAAPRRSSHRQSCAWWIAIRARELAHALFALSRSAARGGEGAHARSCRSTPR
jgi:hypothetical protein